MKDDNEQEVIQLSGNQCNNVKDFLVIENLKMTIFY